ncbi:MAG: hypothetical protein HQK89_06755 [Nitrospirae bacterium]|nr:hypothetical protein [Nitrospirota bacterium]
MHVLLNKRTILFINFLLGLSLGLMALFMARDIISTLSKDNKVSAADPEEPVITQKRKLTDYAAIVTGNPFGLKGQVFTPLVDLEKANVSVEKIKLLGTIAGNRGTGYAVLESEEGRQEIFKVGDDVFHCGKLKTITPKYVVISGGIRIDLADIDANAENPARQSQGASEGSFIRPTSANNYMIDSRKLHEAIDNPKQLMTDARLQPRYANGRQEGFLMQEVRTGGLYDQLGLRNGDVLLSVNKYNITDPETGLQAFTALRGATDIQLDIIRTGTRVTLNYQIR